MNSTPSVELSRLKLTVLKLKTKQRPIHGKTTGKLIAGPMST